MKFLMSFLVTMAVAMGVRGGGMGKKGECMKETFKTLKCCTMSNYKETDEMLQCKEEAKAKDNKKEAFMVCLKIEIQ